jgi:hypothetical protein
MSSKRTTALLLAALAVAACDDDPVQPLDPTLTLTVTPTAVSITPGTFDDVAITALLEDTSEEVEFAVTGGTTGITTQVQDIDVDGFTTTATLVITVQGDVAPGTYTLTLTASNVDTEDDTQAITVTVPQTGGGGA